MSNNFKFSYVNINKEVLEEEVSKRGLYFTNVVVWTVLFSLPLFWLLDYLFLRNSWTDLFLVRLIVGIISYVIYFASLRLKWNYKFTLAFFIGVNVLLNSVICGVLPESNVMPHFFVFSIMMLLLNTTLFWPAFYPVLMSLFSYLVIIIIYAFKPRFDRYNLLIIHGGGVYFIVSAFSCLIAYNRYLILKREIAKSILIDEANNRLLEQNEKINDQRYVIEDANRKLKILNDYRHNTMNMMLHDFKNFTGSIQMSLDLLKNKSENLTAEQKEIINYIGIGNEKLNYLSEKLANSADRDEAKIDFNFANIDINSEVETTVIDVADAAQMKQIGLQLHLSPAPIMVFLDKLFLSQVLFKLMNNVIRYAERGSVITVHTHSVNEKCVLEVINIGKLIGKDKLDELFNKLQPYRSLRDSIQSEAEMGFSVVKKLTESMGGQLTYNSDETTGNYYRIEFNSTH
ncbi:MAG: hypothetical protein KGO81_07270 [Bacteroidota bacterium]|nr:hypothetical protein [Bacteroidota bacterium]